MKKEMIWKSREEELEARMREMERKQKVMQGQLESKSRDSQGGRKQEQRQPRRGSPKGISKRRPKLQRHTKMQKSAIT